MCAGPSWYLHQCPRVVGDQVTSALRSDAELWQLLPHLTYLTSWCGEETEDRKIASLPASLTNRESSHPHGSPRNPRVFPFSLLSPATVSCYSLSPHFALVPTFLAVSPNDPSHPLSGQTSFLTMSFLFLSPFITSTGLLTTDIWMQLSVF